MTQTAGTCSARLGHRSRRAVPARPPASAASRRTVAGSSAGRRPRAAPDRRVRSDRAPRSARRAWSRRAARAASTRRGPRCRSRRARCPPIASGAGAARPACGPSVAAPSGPRSTAAPPLNRSSPSSDSDAIPRTCSRRWVAGDARNANVSVGAGRHPTSGRDRDRVLARGHLSRHDAARDDPSRRAVSTSCEAASAFRIARLYDRADERDRCRTTSVLPTPRGGSGGRMYPSARGGRSARTTAPTGRRGPSSRTTTRAHATYRWSEDGLGAICDDDQLLCFGVRVLERQRPDPQGADLRADRRPGQPRRGRQGVLVVPGLDAEPLVDALALRLPAGGVPLRGSDRGQRPALTDRARVRAARHRRVRPRLVGHRGRVRQGRRRRHLHPRSGPQRRVRAGDAAPAADAVVPQHLVLGRGRDQAVDHVESTARSLRAEHEQLGTVVLAGDGAPAAAVLRQRDQHARGCGAPTGPAYPKDGINDHIARRRGDGQPRPDGDEGGAALPADGRGRRDRRDPAAARPRRP